MKDVGNLVVLEGGDGSGKATQLGLLQERFQGIVSTRIFDFPRYEESLAGKLVGECLAGKHADFRQLSPYLASLPYVLDRVSAREGLFGALKKNLVLCNRYTPSNIAYQTAKLASEERTHFISFLEALEYDELRIPRPSTVIYLYVPTAVATELIKKKAEREYLKGTNQSHDQHERDVAYQDEVIRVYRDLAEQRPNWHVVECVEQGQLLTKETIHERIWSILESYT